MKSRRWPRIVAWIAVVIATATIGLLGLAISSPSVVKEHRQAFLEFGISGFAVTASLLFATRGPWRMIAIPIALYVGWCLEAGWSAESARFDLGGGGPWIAAAPLELLGFLGLLIVATLILMERSVGNVEREQATASDGDKPSI